MTLEQAAPDRVMDWSSATDEDWDALYVDQLPRVLNYFRFRLGRHADVEDLTARTFEKAWRGRARYRRDLAGFSTWLLRIAHNVGTDYLRSLRDHLPLDAALETAAEGTPHETVERESDLARVTQLTARLPARERELIALKYGADIGNRLIAQLTGLSEPNVRVILHRTVQTLRTQWSRRRHSRE
jgi:RNA polymerase sigma-70 factor, ECF subfamily